ncbi:MAG: hypothetical protein IPM35_37050 [Myxococcales bacterium]|nr:hypothetical protein [Myxococcales bacterium]
MLLAIARRAGPWTLGVPLGRGGMAEVFAAESARGERPAPPWLEGSLHSVPKLALGGRVRVHGTITAWQEDPPCVLMSPCEIVP